MVAGLLLRYTRVACLVKYLIAESTTVKDRTFCDASVTSPSHILMIATVSLRWTAPFFRTEHSLWQSRNPLCFYCPTVPYCIPNSPPLAFFLNQMNPFHILSPYYFKIYFNNILLSTFWPSRRVFRFRFVGPKFYVDLRSLWCTPPHPILSHPIPLNRI